MRLSFVALAVLALGSAAAHAQPDERAALQSLRRTTLALIELLVTNGVLTRDKADALLAEAQARGGDATSPQAASATPPAGAAPAPPTVRVPYVPQVVRDQIRDELREEIVARARAERWGVPDAAPEWASRITVEGDLRLRSQTDRPAGANPSPEDFLAASLAGRTRAPDLAAGNAAGLPTANTEEDRHRLRLRARLGVDARIADGVSAGVRLATGSSTDRVSTNQTLGQDFNRYAFLLDRAYIQLDPAPWARITAGRIANPWFSTDLVFSDNLSFEGAAATVRRPASPTASWLPFATVGWFPLREDAPPRRSRSLLAAQVGTQWEPGEATRLRFGLAWYQWQGLEGRVDTDYDAAGGPGRSYGQYEYGSGLRQRGNTLFLTNSPLELQAGLTPDKARWGLASRFRPVALTVAAEFSQFAPVVVGVSGEVVKNTGYNRDEIARRTGLYLDDARVFGAQGRVTVGAAQVRDAGQWQFSLGYRWLGSDAVPDAFVDSDLGGGGTNLRGYTVGGLYGLARDTALGLRYLSARTISSPTVQPDRRDRYGLDTLQVDLNVRF